MYLSSKPSKESVRCWLQRRLVEPGPLPSPVEIRAALRQPQSPALLPTLLGDTVRAQSPVIAGEACSDVSTGGVDSPSRA